MRRDEDDDPREPQTLSPFAWWLIVWGALSAVAMLGAAAQRDWHAFWKAPFGCALLLGIAAGVHYARSPCPGCRRRWAGSYWDHQRNDGGPDRRYQNNARRCRSCGHVFEVYRR